ncbi:MAG TPA: hypothetical protein VMU54_11440 [Planctomycetota bacterium]|nr:hypothetical protein [Planctomycetota bacterium]
MDASCIEDARALWGMLCSRCGRAFSRISGIKLLSFHCPSGHSRSLGDLLERGSDLDLEALEELSLTWEKKLRTLRSIAAQARADDNRELASTIHRRIAVLEDRQCALWDELGNAELRKLGGEAVEATLPPRYK